MVVHLLSTLKYLDENGRSKDQAVCLMDARDQASKSSDFTSLACTLTQLTSIASSASWLSYCSISWDCPGAVARKASGCLQNFLKLVMTQQG